MVFEAATYRALTQGARQVSPVGTVRRMTGEEYRSWTRAVHKACSPEWVPALRFAVANLMPFVDESCPTAYTDCHYRIGLSPDMLNSSITTDEQLAIVVLHETLHNVQKHAQRFEGMGLPQLVKNYVTDFEINSIIASGVCNIDLTERVSTDNVNVHWDWLIGEIIQIETQQQADSLNELYKNEKRPMRVGDKTYQGILLPGIGPLWDIPPGLTAERYLSLIDYEFAGSEAADGGAGAGEQGESNDAGSAGGKGESGNSHEMGGPGVRVYQRHADGSETTIANAGDWVDRVCGNDDLDSWKSVDDLGIHPMERGLENEINDRLIHDIDEYRRSSHAGNASMQVVLNYVSRALRPPVVDWQKILRQVSRKAAQEMTAGRQEYTYLKRRRRSGGAVSGMPDAVEVIYPGQMAYKPKIRLAIDTSGSMSENEYRKVLSEAQGILREFSTSIETVCVDAKAGEVFKVHNIEDITRSLTGGGGTDMTAALRQVADEKPRERPDVLIIGTDGAFRWPRFLEALSDRRLDKTAVVLLCVYRFDEDEYYAKQGSIAQQAQAMKQRKRNAYLVQAWVE